MYLWYIRSLIWLHYSNFQSYEYVREVTVQSRHLWPRPWSPIFPDDGGVGVLVSPGDELVEGDAGDVEVGRGRGEGITAVVAVVGPREASPNVGGPAARGRPRRPARRGGGKPF